MQKQDLRTAKLYKTPFSPDYWRTAVKQLFDVRILCITAVMIAMRVALKSLWIPVGPQLNITVGFFVNALGASIFGPVVAVIAAAISDTLGCILFPAGTYFFPFIFVEIAGSLIFALFLWRTKLSATRIILSRFTVVAVCNLILNPSIMIWYYSWLNNGGTYEFITMPRVIKNLALFPAEALLLVIFLGALIPVMVRLRLMPKAQTGDTMISKKHVILLVILFIIAAVIVACYYFIFLPTQPTSASATEGDFKLTLRSERGTYRLNTLDPDAPLLLTATLKNEGSADITAFHEYELCDITLIHEDGTRMPVPPHVEGTSETVIEAGKSVKLTDCFAWEYEQLGGLPKGDYTAVATVSMIVDGEPCEITVKLPIKIK